MKTVPINTAAIQYKFALKNCMIQKGMIKNKTDDRAKQCSQKFEIFERNIAKFSDFAPFVSAGRIEVKNCQKKEVKIVVQKV